MKTEYSEYVVYDENMCYTLIWKGLKDWTTLNFFHKLVQNYSGHTSMKAKKHKTKSCLTKSHFNAKDGKKSLDSSAPYFGHCKFHNGNGELVK